MGAGKYLAIIAALLTILGTFLFSWLGVATIHMSGLGFFNEIGTKMQNIDLFALGAGVDTIVAYILIVLVILVIISGFIQLAGIKSRAAIGIFSIFPLILGFIFILGEYANVLFNEAVFIGIMTIGNQIGDVIPFNIALDGLNLGVYLILGGGVLGIISAALPREDVY